MVKVAEPVWPRRDRTRALNGYGDGHETGSVTGGAAVGDDGGFADECRASLLQSMAAVLVERLRAAGVKIDDPERWTVEAAADVGDGPDAGLGPLTQEVDAWIGAVRRRPAGRPPPITPPRAARRTARC